MTIRSLATAVAFTLSLSVSAGCANRAKQSVSLYEKGDYAGAAHAADEQLAQHPNDDDLLAMRIRAALAQGDASAIATTYARLHDARGDEDDAHLISELARATLEQALTSPSTKMKLVAIDAVERNELHDLADLVAQRMEDRDDKVVAAAATAILSAYSQAPGALRALLSSPDPGARALAVEGLGRKVIKKLSGGYRADAFANLVEAAGDEDARVRRISIRWLGHYKVSEGVDVITRHTKDPDEGVRAASYTALGAIGAGDLSALAALALADKALAVRLVGVELYAQAKNTAALSALAESEPDATVALEAAIAAKLRDAAKRQIAKAVADERWAIRAGAANLARRALDASDAEAVLAGLAKDPEMSVRLAAARGLMGLGDAQRALATEILVAALQSPGHALAAAPDLVRLGDDRGALVLEATLQSAPQASDRIAAVSAHRIARRITPWLVAALADKNGLVRVEAAAALVDLTRDSD